MSMRWTRPLGTTLAAVLLLGMTAGTAWATSATELQNRLNAAREHLAQLGTDPMADTAATEIEHARIDIDEASQRLTNHLEELAEVSVIRLENRVKLIEAMIQQATVEALADERESAAVDMTQQADQAQVQYESTEARRTALRSDVSEILEQLEVGND
jgi:chromosome segregation ATPase